MRLWRILRHVQKTPGSREDIRVALGMQDHLLTLDMGRLRKLGAVRFRRSIDRYEVTWPESSTSVELSPYEYFLSRLAISQHRELFHLDDNPAK